MDYCAWGKQKREPVSVPFKKIGSDLLFHKHNLVKEDLYESFLTQVQQRYKARFGIDCQSIPVVISAGARRL